MKRKGNWKSPRSHSSVWFVPELGIEIRVDSVNTNKSVAHFPTGLERVERSVINNEWVYKGDWEKLKKETDNAM